MPGTDLVARTRTRLSTRFVFLSHALGACYQGFPELVVRNFLGNTPEPDGRRAREPSPIMILLFNQY